MVDTKNTESVLGLDIGGTQIKSIVFQKPESIIASFECPSHANEGPDAVRAAVLEVVGYYRKSGISYSSIGIGCAGSVDQERGVIRNSPYFRQWKDVALGSWLTSTTGMPVIIENDAKCAIFAEWKIGNAKDCRNAILLTFGTGIGGGLILNGELYRGSTGTAGELGHYSIHARGKPCNCGNTGCFERYCSGSALQEQFGNTFSAAQIFEQANQPQFCETVELFMSDLRVGLTSLSNIFDPDRILIGGGLLPGLLPYLDDIALWVRNHAFSAVGSNVRIVPTKHGNLSGAMGAALIALQSQAKQHS